MKMQLRSFARKVVTTSVYWSGIGRLYELGANPAGAIILMYHSVAPDDLAAFIAPRNRISPDAFDAQMAFLCKSRRVAPLSQVVEQILAGETPLPGTVCITFDDGYLDNLTTAAPILEKYELPATLYLATGYVDRGESQWADTLYWVFQQRTADSLRIPSLAIDATGLATDTVRTGLLETLHRYLLEAEYHERKQLLDEIKRQLAPEECSPRLTLNWDEVRELRRRFPLFEIGGHTRDHLDLRKYRGNKAHGEINGCANDLKRELGASPQHFSFPYGRWCDETQDIVRESGWRSAVGISSSIRVVASSDRFAIPRIEAPQNKTDLRFRTSGAYPGVLSILRMK